MDPGNLLSLFGMTAFTLIGAVMSVKENNNQFESIAYTIILPACFILLLTFRDTSNTFWENFTLWVHIIIIGLINIIIFGIHINRIIERRKSNF